MKKILLLLFAALMGVVNVANAETITLWESTTPEGDLISWNNACYEKNNIDLSEGDVITITVAGVDPDVEWPQATLRTSDETWGWQGLLNKGGFSAGNTYEYVITAEIAEKVAVHRHIFFGGEGAYISKVELTPSNSPRKDVLSVCKTYEPTKSWDWFETGTSAPSNYNYFVVELAEASETVVNVKLLDSSNGNISTGKIAAGDFAVKIALNDETKANIAKIVLQNETVSNFTVSNAFFANEEYMTSYILPVPNTKNLSLSNLNGGWNSSYDADTHTITIDPDKENGGKGWWLGEQDYSWYDNLVISFESTTSLGKIVIEYNGQESTSLSFGKGATTVVVPFATDGRKSSVKQIYIQGNTKETFTLTEAYVATAESTPPTSNLGVYPLTLSKDKISFSHPSYVLDFSETDVKAYIVTSISDNAANLEQAGEVAANTGVILVGKANTNYDIPVIASTSESMDLNLLKPGDTTVDANSVYVLSDGEFKLFTGTEIPWGKAYLPKSVVGAHELSLNFGDATGIKNIKVGTEDNVYYDLQGRRVLYPTKGLYIVNGKKVIVK